MITESLFWALPVLLAALLTSIITRKHKERERFDNAADEVRKICNKAILDLADASVTYDDFTSRIKSQQIVFLNFRSHVVGRKAIETYDQTCDNYYNNIRPYWEYDRTVILQTLDEIINFTK